MLPILDTVIEPGLARIGRLIQVFHLEISLVIAVVLGLSIWVGTQARSLAGLSLSANPIRLVVGLGGIALLALIIKDLRRGLTLLIFAAGVIDIPIGTGTQSAVNLAMVLTALILVAWLLRIMVQRQASLLVASSVNRPLLLFVAVLLLSWLFGYVLWDVRVMLPSNALTVQAGQVGVFVLSATALFLTANAPISVRMLKIWTFAAILVAVLGQAALIMNIPNQSVLAIVKPPLAIGFVLLISQLLLNANQRPWLKLLGWGVVVGWAVTTFGSDRVSFVGGWLPIAIGAMLILWLRSRSLFFALAALGLLAVVIFPEPFLREYSSESASGSLLRPYIWWDIVRMTLGSPLSILFGLGPVNYLWNWRNPSFSSLSRPLTTGFEVEYIPPAHNMFIDIYAQTGLIGLLLFASVLLLVVRVGLQLVNTFDSGFLRAYAAGVVAAFVGLAVVSGIAADWLVPFVYNIGLTGFRSSVYAWLFAGTLFALAAVKRDLYPGGQGNA